MSGHTRHGKDPAPIPSKIVDLSETIREDTPLRFWGSKMLKDFGFSETTKFRHVETEEPLYVADSYIELFNHGGPHVDAPNHLDREAPGIDFFSLDNYIGNARIFDLRSWPNDEPLPLKVFEDKEIQTGDIVIAFVGYKPPTGPDEVPTFAYLSTEAAEYLASVPIKAFGTDAFSVDSINRLYELMGQGVTGYKGLVPVHHALLKKEIPLFEQLVNLEAVVGEEDVVFIGFPLKIKDGNASPVRAAALIY